MGPRQQGDRGEWAAREWFAQQGADVFIPLGHSPDIDLIALTEGVVSRVQVKSSGFRRDGRWNVAVCTRGGNQSWSGITKRLDSERYDLLFVLVADGRRWRIPAKKVMGQTSINLGGPQYAEWEVEPAPHWAWAPASVH